jgi:hypothetical protein
MTLYGDLLYWISPKMVLKTWKLQV